MLQKPSLYKGVEKMEEIAKRNPQVIFLWKQVLQSERTPYFKDVFFLYGKAKYYFPFIS